MLILGGTFVLILSFLFATQRRQFLLPGPTSDGHFLVEQACASCHRGFEPVVNEDCESCHVAELAKDTHPTRLFEDPRWAEDLEHIDALHCSTCHFEHEVAKGGVTVDPQFCFYCHDDVVDKRPTHANLSQVSCGNAGCHNYHDNTALNTAFLQKRADQPNLFETLNLLARSQTTTTSAAPAADHPSSVEPSGDLLAAWRQSSHAVQAVNCSDCHLDEAGSFVLEPSSQSCASCHEFETDTFHAGKHGVRTSLELAALTPEMARLPMQKATESRPSMLSCSTCHDPHSVDTVRAATQACLQCHADDHSLAFEASPHAQPARMVANSNGSNDGTLTCATCHLPRVERRAEAGTMRVAVDHNNTFTLRPPDRMAEMVCSACHGLEFSLSSLVDQELIANNFDGPPSEQHPTFPMLEQSLAAIASSGSPLP